MMCLSDKIEKENKGTVTLTDRIWEMAALVLAIFLIALSFVLYTYLPEQVPIHFNGLGEADGWGNKKMIFILPVIGIAAMAICSAAAYYPKMINLPVRLNPECLPQQLTLMGRMTRILSVLCGLLFTVLLLMTAGPHWGIQSVCFPFFLIITGSLLVVPLIYSILIQKVGKQCK